MRNMCASLTCVIVQKVNIGSASFDIKTENLKSRTSDDDEKFSLLHLRWEIESTRWRRRFIGFVFCLVNWNIQFFVVREWERLSLRNPHVKYMIGQFIEFIANHYLRFSWKSFIIDSILIHHNFLHTYFSLMRTKMGWQEV